MYENLTINKYIKSKVVKRMDTNMAYYNVA